MSAHTRFQGAVNAPPRSRRPTTVVAAAVAVGALSAGFALAGAAPASAAANAVSGVTLSWGLSGEQGGGAFFGGCNFLSAGVPGNTGTSRPWTEADGFYKTQVGNVTVTKPNTNGEFSQPTWSTKCQGPDGLPVSPGSPTSLTRNQVTFSAGTGTVNVASNTASIAWTGSFASAFYGGLTYWWATNPVLTISRGTGTLTATVAGYGASMDDASRWIKIPPRKVRLATLTGLAVTDTGFTATPEYLGVVVDTTGASTAQSAPGSPFHGAFPQGFINFQLLTGQSSYWYSSGGSRDAAKPAVPLSVGWEVPPVVAPSFTAQPQSATVADGDDVTFSVEVTGAKNQQVVWKVLPKGSSTWTKVVGATGPTLTLTDVDASDHGSRYRAVASNSAGRTASSVALLKVVSAT